jgi:hypothetical protein
MNAITAFAVVVVPFSANCAEKTVCSVKNTSMPNADEMNKSRRPSRSTRNAAVSAQNKFQI